MAEEQEQAIGELKAFFGRTLLDRDIWFAF